MMSWSWEMGPTLVAALAPLVGVPLGLFLGQEGISAATGNSGIQSVEVGFRRITDPSLPITDSLSVPTSWQTTTLATPNQTASYWTRTLTPASGDGLETLGSGTLRTSSHAPP